MISIIGVLVGMLWARVGLWLVYGTRQTIP
jgi:hypothetical protein